MIFLGLPTIRFTNKIEQYTNISWVHSTDRHYLNDGRGEACAGHDNDKAKPNGFWYNPQAR